MKVIVQVVKNANVKINSEIYSSINNGYLLLVGFEKNDSIEIIDKMVDKIINMRINKDDYGKTNLSLKEVNGSILSISQFTLAADVSSRRPSFSNSLEKHLALDYYNLFNLKLFQKGFDVKTGIFGEYMEVNLSNDGPFTIILDSNNI